MAEIPKCPDCEEIIDPRIEIDRNGCGNPPDPGR